MIKREKYLNKIKEFYNTTNLIKIIYGIRRSGKSVLLTQIMEEIKKEYKVDNNHIIYINFESLEYAHIDDAFKLDKYIKSLVKDKKIYYVFLDEIQKVENFEKAINSLRITDKFSIFITGSNSRMTFREISTDLSGRYVSFKVTPFTFKESIKITKTKKEDYEKLLFDIFEWGTLPQRFMFDTEQAKTNYITDIYNSIVIKDVIERLNLKDVTTFNKILQYILETEGREFSAKNIQAYLEQNYKTISNETLYTYIDALCSTFLINKVYRYDIEGKAVLKTLNKFYVSDLGIKKSKTNKKEVNLSVAMENIVYNSLVNKGYEVYIGKLKNGEIDFIAIKDKTKKYIQVTSYLNEEKTIEREFSAFNKIEDNHEKYVISLDKENKSQDGIKHLNVIDFLLDDKF